MAARAPAIIFLFLGKTQKGGNGEKDKKVLFFEMEKLQVRSSPKAVFLEGSHTSAFQVPGNFPMVIVSCDEAYHLLRMHWQ